MMSKAWHYDGIIISDIASVDIGTGPTIRGTGQKGNQPFEYHAHLTPQGWSVSIFSINGRVGAYDGVTFNLPLEIATAARRFTL